MAVASPSVAAAAGRGDQEDRPPTSPATRSATTRGMSRSSRHACLAEDEGDLGPGRDRLPLLECGPVPESHRRSPPPPRAWGQYAVDGDRHGGPQENDERGEQHGSEQRARPRRALAARVRHPSSLAAGWTARSNPDDRRGGRHRQGRVGTGRRTCPAHAGQNIPLKSQVPLGVTPVRREPAEVHTSIPG